MVFYAFVFGVSLTFNTTQHNMGLVTLVKKKLTPHFVSCSQSNYSSLSMLLISEWKALEHRIAAARSVSVRAVNKSETVRWARWRGDKGLGSLCQILLLLPSP